MTSRHLLTVALLITLPGLSGCSSSPGSDVSPASTNAPPSSAPVAPLPAITFDQAGGGGVTCVKTAGESRSVAALDSAIAVNTDLVINDVTIESNSSVTLVIKDSLNLPPVNPGGAIAYSAILDWPLTQETASGNVRWVARDALIGRSYAAGETGLPVLHLIGKPGGSVGSVVYRYTSDTEPNGEARYDLNLRFAKRC